MSTNWFGNSFAPALSYARGAILTSTEEDFRKLRHAWHGLPLEILERFGGPERFARAVDASLDRLATFVKNPGRLPEFLFGKA